MNVAELKLLIQNTLKTTPADYRSQADDISVESDLLTFYLLRERSCSDRLHMAAAMNREARGLSLYCLKQQFKHLDPTQLARSIARAWLQDDCPDGFTPTGNEMTWIQDSISIARDLHGILENAGIAYYITGGVAAITYGEPRTTRDLDLVVSVAPENIDSLVEVLESNEFYVLGVEEVKSGRMKTLNITQTTSISRADLILAGTTELDLLQFSRRVSLDIEGVGFLYFASPEDVILNKLNWGKRSRSEKQWRDVLGILKVKSNDLDLDYLRIWAENLGIRDDLSQALAEAGLG